MENLKQIFMGKVDLERRMVAFYAYGAITVTLVFAAVITLYGAPELGALLLGLAIGNSPVYVILKKKQNFQKAVYYLLINGSLTMTISIALVGSLHGHVAYWIGLLPLAGGLLLQRKGIIFSLVLAALSILTLALWDLWNQGRIQLVAPDRVYLIFSLVMFISMIGFMAFLFVESNRLVVLEQTRKLDNLLNIVTHDISNPLTLISGHAELMIIQGQASNLHTMALKKIARASDMITDILKKVRTIQAAKAGKLIVETTPVSLSEVFDKLRFIFESKIKEKQQTLKIDLPSSLQNAKVIAEPVLLLNEVLSNLLSNAIKFSAPRSEISIVVAKNLDGIRIEVKDQGIGIPDSLLPHIFDDFRSTSRPGTEGETGTGFGLPLARHVVEAFGGTLRAESKSKKDQKEQSGTTFILLLRIPQADIKNSTHLSPKAS